MKHATLVNHPPQVTLPSDNRAIGAAVYQSVQFTFDKIS